MAGGSTLRLAAFIAPARPSVNADPALACGALVALGVHAAAFAAVLLVPTTVATVMPAPPIMVSMLAVPAPPPTVPAQKPQPLPLRTPPLPPMPQPLLAAATNPAIIPAADAPAPQPPPTVAAPAEVAMPVAVIPPRFDAAYLDNPAPLYPPAARRLGEQGKVLLRVLVNADGTAAQVELKNGSGSPRLDQAALDTVKRWRFVAAKQGTQAVTAWVLVPIAFTLGG